VHQELEKRTPPADKPFHMPEIFRTAAKKLPIALDASRPNVLIWGLIEMPVGGTRIAHSATSMVLGSEPLFADGRPHMATTLANADQKLREAAIRQLEWDPQVDASLIDVSVLSGVVTLTGCVETLTARLEAERAVNEVGGVTGVVNNLEVRIY
jgi:hypothetical protein